MLKISHILRLVYNKIPSLDDRLIVAAVLFILPLPSLLTAGCRSVNQDIIEGTAAHSRPESDLQRISAGIAVAARETPGSRTIRYFWGITYTYDPEKTFGDLLAHILENRYQMQTVRINDLQNTESSPSSRLPCGQEPDVDYIFAAEIYSWYQSYLLFLQWSGIHYKLHCYEVKSGKRLWMTERSLTNLYTTHREVLLDALEDSLAEVFNER